MTVGWQQEGHLAVKLFAKLMNDVEKGKHSY